jgi:hypothetical protein
VYKHPAYTNPKLLGNVARKIMENLDPNIIKGDPDKVTLCTGKHPWTDGRPQLAQRLHELANLEDPPMRVMLGVEGPQMLQQKLKRDAAEREEYAAWADGLSFDE